VLVLVVLVVVLLLLLLLAVLVLMLVLNLTRIQAFFKEFVPGAKAGDDAVHAYHGESKAAATKTGGDESSLDIQVHKDPSSVHT